MATLSRGVSGMAQFLLFAFLLTPASALYFYLDNTTPKCFFEDLPKDTLVVGHYTAELYNSANNAYEHSSNLQLLITVTEVFDNDHPIVTQRSQNTGKGKFTFTAAEAGEHRICFAPNRANHHGGHDAQNDQIGSVKLTVDLAIGQTSKIEAHDQGKIDDIVQKVKDLNLRLQDVRREQVYQREREAEFRDQSESTNARVVRWTVIQLVVLGVTCAWQLSHLRAFFIKQKLT